MTFKIIDKSAMICSVWLVLMRSHAARRAFCWQTRKFAVYFNSDPVPTNSAELQTLEKDRQTMCIYEQ